MACRSSHYPVLWLLLVVNVFCSCQQMSPLWNHPQMWSRTAVPRFAPICRPTRTMDHRHTTTLRPWGRLIMPTHTQVWGSGTESEAALLCFFHCLGISLSGCTVWRWRLLSSAEMTLCSCILEVLGLNLD